MGATHRKRCESGGLHPHYNDAVIPTRGIAKGLSSDGCVFLSSWNRAYGEPQTVSSAFRGPKVNGRRVGPAEWAISKLQPFMIARAPANWVYHNGTSHK